MAPHPLDPLSTDELRSAASACRAYHSLDGAPLRYNVITLQEPPKADLIAFGKDGTAPPRQAFCILQAPPSTLAIEAVVDLSSGPKAGVSSWKEVDGVKPLATPDDCFEAEDICKADAKVVAMLKERGLENMSLVVCDPWSVHMAPSDLADCKLIQLFMYFRTEPNDNHYAHPLDFTPIVDLYQKKVVRIDMPHGDRKQELPKKSVNYHRELAEKGWRKGLKPLTVTQPEGPSFTVEGNLIKWQKWHIRHSFNYREGLVLHDVGYEDDGRVRPVLHRASLVEMCVPYADPNPPYQRKCAFDVGDYGLGYCANSLELGCDCLGTIKYFDADMIDSKGDPWTVKKAVCVHEEDAGICWKHTEYRDGHAEVRRNRRLVLSFIATVVNYEYAFYWSFYLDGSIGYEIKLTGELSTNLLSPGEESPGWGTYVADRVNSQHHQHMFCARLDFAVDDEEGGKGLQVSEVEVAPMDDGPANPFGNGFVAMETPLTKESEAQRVCNPQTARYWKVSNPSSMHPVTGKPVAWKLMPQAAPVLLAKPDSAIAKRGAFAQKNLWVTPHADAERWPAGDYPLQSTGGQGLAEWTQQDRPVGPGEDPVVWYCFGVTHIPRPEDFPVMPVEVVGFTLKPFGFFDGNPAVDLPHAPDTGSVLANGNCCANGDHANGHANGNGVTH